MLYFLWHCFALFLKKWKKAYDALIVLMLLEHCRVIALLNKEIKWKKAALVSVKLVR